MSSAIAKSTKFVKKWFGFVLYIFELILSGWLCLFLNGSRLMQNLTYGFSRLQIEIDVRRRYLKLEMTLM